MEEFLLAVFSITSNASPVAAVITGTPGFIMQAFSVAISLIFSPKYSEWSIEILVITEARGVITFVASHLPPIPTSNTLKSTFSLAKYTNAAAVIISK